jgi:hypothetical protein
MGSGFGGGGAPYLGAGETGSGFIGAPYSAWVALGSGAGVEAGGGVTTAPGSGLVAGWLVIVAGSGLTSTGIGFLGSSALVLQPAMASVTPTKIAVACSRNDAD